MVRNSLFRTFMAGLLALMLYVPAHADSLNKSIKIGAGEDSGARSSVNGSITVGSDATVSGPLETVNGAIRIDKDAVISDASTVNGSVRLDAGVSAEDVSSVNGSIRLGKNVNVSGEVSVVNGKIELRDGTKVSGDVSNVNGEISLSAAEVGGDLTTVNGDVSLQDTSILRGDLVVERPNSWGWGKTNKPPRVVIGPGSRVEGQIVLEREVELYISETADVREVTGEMGIDDAVRFSGKKP